MDDLWQQITQAAVKEFSDVGDAAQATRLVLRLLVAGLLGGLLGIEREQTGHAAGVRTHMLVAMGSALFVLVSQQSGIAASDMSRVIQGLIAGIGFLGAGTIIKSQNEEKVKGLTTAAGIWMTAAIGMAAGLGQEVTAVISTLLALAIFSLVPWAVRRTLSPNKKIATEATRGNGLSAPRSAPDSNPGP